ncbi:uncharacterized protein MELLADRAFT_92732 [Melampsora larici-populina 98AG31]|uniref:Uncharacterized protein n=1 Tax=Melampsora larici-populina (strain 98AG31 / pathotype 3-4-7) TaxID=747676 RepID=F4S2W6_MELLP|nr:uncharacterized protein MELLADRAFT_92732 [Melampsora larici-populina 98AG31]EGG01119.1 hypothetical protein MELLADRAFT_92732 [Melampsora larici-populina 98AG31]
MTILTTQHIKLLPLQILLPQIQSHSFITTSLSNLLPYLSTYYHALNITTPSIEALNLTTIPQILLNCWYLTLHLLSIPIHSTPN